MTQYLVHTQTVYGLMAGAAIAGVLMGYGLPRPEWRQPDSSHNENPAVCDYGPRDTPGKDGWIHVHHPGTIFVHVTGIEATFLGHYNSERGYYVVWRDGDTLRHEWWLTCEFEVKREVEVRGGVTI